MLRQKAIFLAGATLLLLACSDWGANAQNAQQYWQCRQQSAGVDPGWCPTSTTNPLPVTASAPTGTQDTNLKQVNGATVNVGVGAAGTGTQRITTSSDSTVGLVAGTAVIGHVITDTGSTTAVTGTVTTSGAVFGPTAVGSPAANPPVYMGGSVGGGASNNIIGLNLTSNGQLLVTQGTASSLNATVVGNGTFAVQAATSPAARTLVTLDVKTVTTGGTAVTAISAGHRTAGGFLQNPIGATIALCVNEIGTATGTTSSGDTTCIQPGQSYTVSPASTAVSVISSDSTHPFSGYGLN